MADETQRAEAWLLVDKFGEGNREEMKRCLTMAFRAGALWEPQGWTLVSAQENQDGG